MPTANLPVLQKIGKGEGQLNLIAWAGYLQPEWVKPFQQQTGCIIHATYPNTSDEFVTLMKNGGGGVWDMASSSGDADLRIIYAGDAHPVNIKLIPSWNQFFPAFKSPPFNTVNGVHYGVSLQWGPNVLMYSKKAFKTPPTSWSVVYSKNYAGKISIYDGPIYIADAALYLKAHDPSLGITDPYELTQPQFQAAVNLLKCQHPLVKQYWSSASAQISAFANGDVTVGSSWPYQVSTLDGAALPDRRGDPEGGRHRVGGHLDARRQSTAPELRLHVDALYQHAEGPGRAGRELWRNARQHVGLRLHEPDREGLLRAVSRQRPGRVLQLHRVVEDTGSDVRQRQNGLRALCRLGGGVEYADHVGYQQDSADDGRDHTGRGRNHGPGPVVPRKGPGRAISALLWRRPWTRATVLLTPPLAWFLLIYVASLAVLLITAFWTTNPFTTNIEHTWTLVQLRQILGTPAYRTIIARTVGIAAGVTVVDAIIAIPFAYYMARVARPRTRDIPVRLRTAAAVGQLPGQGLRLAADPQP